MTHASSFTRAQEPERYVAFEPGEPPIPTGFPMTRNGEPDFAAIRAHPDFVRVRRRLTRFIFPASGLFFAWYLTYVLLAAYAPGLMGHRVFGGSVTLALLLGLSQFVTTVVIMLWYARFTKRSVDPEIEELRRMAGENDHER